MNKLSVAETAALYDVAEAIGAQPEHLYKVIQFESGWNPQVKNPRSSARGLIQFIDSTARELGYADSADLVEENPTRLDQLKGPVLKYLKRYAPLPTEQALFMAIFYPVARHWPANRQFPEHVQKVNPGIKTPADYVAYANGRKPGHMPAASLAVAAVAGLAGFFFMRST